MGLQSAQDIDTREEGICNNNCSSLPRDRTGGGLCSGFFTYELGQPRWLGFRDLASTLFFSCNNFDRQASPDSRMNIAQLTRPAHMKRPSSG